jgi:hypothetical protein
MILAGKKDVLGKKHPSVPFFHYKSRTHLNGIKTEWPKNDDQSDDTAEKNLKCINKEK